MIRQLSHSIKITVTTVGLLRREDGIIKRFGTLLDSENASDT